MRKLSTLKDFLSGGGQNIIYCMPHHGVLRENSLTTRLRVVFDCSAAIATKTSLNDILITGPTLQSDLICILLRFRMCNYVVSADIEKMYRQVLVRTKENINVFYGVKILRTI